MKNTKLYNGKQRYELRASNGQVLEHGFTSQKAVFSRIKEYKKIYPSERFSIMGYDNGKYGNE